MAEQQTVFRKKTIERISSPEQLTSCLRVTNPGIWVVLTAVILLLAGVFAWAAVGTLETGVAATVIVEARTAKVVPAEAQTLAAGMPLRVAGQEYAIASAGPDEFGRSVGTAALDLPDGIYAGTVVVEQTRPLDFLLTSR